MRKPKRKVTTQVRHCGYCGRFLTKKDVSKIICRECSNDPANDPWLNREFEIVSCEQLSNR